MWMLWLHQHQNCNPPLELITLPEGCSISLADFIIPVINSFTSRLPTALWGYQYDPFLNNSDPLFNFKLMSAFGLTNLMKMKSNFILSRLFPITDVPIVNFMTTLEEINDEYNITFSLLLITSGKTHFVGYPHMFGHPLYVWTPPYVWIPPVCLDAPICLDAPTVCLDSPLYVWIPPVCLNAPCLDTAICLETLLYVLMPHMLGHHPMCECLPVCLGTPYFWIPPYVWMPPYIPDQVQALQILGHLHPPLWVWDLDTPCLDRK